MGHRSKDFNRKAEKHSRTGPGLLVKESDISPPEKLQNTLCIFQACGNFQPVSECVNSETSFGVVSKVIKFNPRIDNE